MKLKKFLAFCLTVCLLTALSAPVFAIPPEEAKAEARKNEIIEETQDKEEAEETEEAEGTEDDGSIFASPVGAALLIETTTDTELYAMNADEQKYPASLTKIVTCMLALEHSDLNETVTVSETALDGFVAGDGTMNLDHLQVGEEIRMEDLLYFLMLESANEACVVVAEHIAGSVDAFVAMMNEKARELGCTGTNFVNPHGLHDENHYTTARDISKLVRKALENDTFRAITSTASYTFPATNKREAQVIYTTNQLIHKEMAGNNFYYSKASGVKTGFTTPAGRCLVATASNENINLLSIVLQAQTLENEHGIWVYRSFPETINLCEWAFENYCISTVMSTLYPVAEIPVNMAAGSDVVALAPAQEVRVLIESDYDPSLITLKPELYVSSVDAPVEAGQVVGKVTVYYEDRELGSSDLAAITAVARSEVAHQSHQVKAYAADNWWKWLMGIIITIAVIIAIVYLFLVYYRRQQRRRKVAARRRALELQRRRREWNLPEE